MPESAGSCFNLPQENIFYLCFNLPQGLLCYRERNTSIENTFYLCFNLPQGLLCYRERNTSIENTFYHIYVYIYAVYKQLQHASRYAFL
jgi:hypothetical protein